MSDLLKKFIRSLRQADALLSADIGIGPGVEEIADMLWLAKHISTKIETVESSSAQSRNKNEFSSLPPPNESNKQANSNTTNEHPNQNSESKGTLVTDPETNSQTSTSNEFVEPIRVPAAAAVRQPLKFARALKPLVRKIDSKTEKMIDEEATAISIAQDRRMGIIQRPTQERWLELEVVIEQSRTVDLWARTTQEFVLVLEQLGAFRTIRLWTLETVKDPCNNLRPRLRAGQKTSNSTQSRLGNPNELVDPTGNRMVMVISDCISALWRDGIIHNWLSHWGLHCQLVLVQRFPERYWNQTSLQYGDEVWLSSFSPGNKSHRLTRHYPAFNPEAWEKFEESVLSEDLEEREDEDDDFHSEISKKKALILPIVSLEPESLQMWAGVVAGHGNSYIRGRRFELTHQNEEWRGPTYEQKSLPLSGLERVELFYETTSDMAQELAKLMSLAPVSPEITNLIQETLLPKSTTVHVAEVFLSGLLVPADQERYHFYPGVQEQLQKSTLRVDKQLVFRVLSRYINNRFGRTPREFNAFIQKHSDWDKGQWEEIEGFAELEQKSKSTFTLPPLQTLKFIRARFADLSLPDPYFPPVLYTEKFPVAEIILDHQENPPVETEYTFTSATIIQRDQEWVIERNTIKLPLDHILVESLSEDVSLNLIKIPSGKFMMGSPKTEPDRWDDESPLHQVIISTPFFMGQFPITEAQWGCVCKLRQEKLPLKLPEESNGDDYPIVKISWLEAKEFCDRLSTHTGRKYRLPTEAEWEYACRARTTTPFHFGETVSPKLANYDSNSSYNNGPNEESPRGTTPVGQYNAANGFGLSDMHGNVWEWCQDNWHRNYEDAPDDGSAWGNQDDATHVVRGGSWSDDPGYCRSAARVNDLIVNVGFRVACSAPRT